MSITSLGIPTRIGSFGSDKENRSHGAGSLPFTDVFNAATSQARRSADTSILDAARGSSATSPSMRINPADLRREAEGALAGINQKLQKLLEDADVDTSIEIRLVGDGNGGVQLAGSHPDEEKINEILASQPDLARQFHDMLSMFTRLQANTTSALGPSSGMLSMVLNEQKARIEFEPVSELQ